VARGGTIDTRGGKSYDRLLQNCVSYPEATIEYQREASLALGGTLFFPGKKTRAFEPID
jgi:hypothetical protein